MQSHIRTGYCGMSDWYSVSRIGIVYLSGNKCMWFLIKPTVSLNGDIHVFMDAFIHLCRSGTGWIGTIQSLDTIQFVPRRGPPVQSRYQKHQLSPSVEIKIKIHLKIWSQSRPNFQGRTPLALAFCFFPFRIPTLGLSWCFRGVGLGGFHPVPGTWIVREDLSLVQFKLYQGGVQILHPP